ncbi:MAG TPA: BON domain-containing protein [Longimicrobiaceae bacterium]|nr:BON domain-containing protein [Longimicrobiaceae bacterium]
MGAYRRWEPLWDGQGGGPRDGGFAYGYGSAGGGEPFIPDEAYRRHPELQRGRHEADPWAGHGSGAPGDRALTDDEVARCVCEALERDSWLEADRIEVKVSEGVVTLTGEVGDYMEARFAWDDAWEAEGVRGVISHLAVNPSADEEPHGDPMPQQIHTER